MFRKLKIKVVATIMGLLAFVFIAVLIAINTLSYNRSMDMAFMELRDTAERQNKAEQTPDMPPVLPLKSSPKQAKAFVHFDKEGNITEITGAELCSSTVLAEYANKVINSKKSYGKIDNLLYHISEHSLEKTVVFMDNSLQDGYQGTIFRYTLIFGSIGLAVIFLLSILLAEWMVRPVELTFEKQKHFISDAGHELKTPIAVINANLEVLTKEYKDNKWLSYISSETERMKLLVENLLSLARLDTKKTVHNTFNLSQAVTGAAMPFESAAYENGLTLLFDIEENLSYTGNSLQLQQLTAILLDNAVKYSVRNGRIIVSLHKSGHKLILSVCNSGTPIPISERQKVFDRFYRLDEARTGSAKSYGLGLSIAKSITEQHHAKIFTDECFMPKDSSSADTSISERMTRFSVVL